MTHLRLGQNNERSIIRFDEPNVNPDDIGDILRVLSNFAVLDTDTGFATSGSGAPEYTGFSVKLPRAPLARSSVMIEFSSILTANLNHNQSLLLQSFDGVTRTPIVLVGQSYTWQFNCQNGGGGAYPAAFRRRFSPLGVNYTYELWATDSGSGDDLNLGAGNQGNNTLSVRELL